MATNTVFIITDTAGVPIAAIEPNTLNGPGGVQQSSDLSLFGLGYATWGQASDQNDYRLLENFACPQSVTHPTPVQPMGTSELGNGNGINEPIIGQLWFNTTTQAMYVNTATGWSPVSLETTVSSTPPSGTLAQGQLWFNTSLISSLPPGPPQSLLNVWTGTAWASVAGLYLPLSGGTMSGPINMGAQNITNVNNVATGSIQANTYQSSSGPTSNAISIPNTGNTTITDGPRIGPFVIYHTGNASSLNQFADSMIIAWFGLPTSLPTGWSLCDGGTHNGHLTPNLIGQIPFGANPSLANVGAQTLNINSAGADASLTVTISGTALSISQLPVHSHPTVFYTGGGTATAGPPGTGPGGTYFTEGNNTNGVAQTVTSGSIGSGATHTHTVSQSQTPHIHSVPVPVYGLYYIMYTG